MKDLDRPRKHSLDAEILMIPVSSGAIQAALAGEIRFMTSGGVANINANMSGGDFVGITSMISTFVFKIIGQPGIKEPSQLKGKKVATSRLGALKPHDFIDPSILQEIEESGFVRKLYGN